MSESGATLSDTSQRLLIRAVLISIIIFAVYYAQVVYAPCDDAYISFVYVRNLVEGNGLTYNGMRVQGFTSPLWMMALAIGGSFFPSAIPWVGESLSMLAGALTLIAVYWLARSASLPPARAWFAPLLLASCGNFAFYMGSGLETVAASGLFVVAVAPLFTATDPHKSLRSWWLPCALALASLMRPEGLLLVPCVLGGLIARGRGGGQSEGSADLRTALLCGFRAAVLVALVIVGLRLYYSHWLPNTYFVKTGAGLANLAQGVTYMKSFVLLSPLISVGWVMATLFTRRRTAPAVVSVAVFVCLWVARLVSQGGDNMVGHRMMVPILPCVCVVLVLATKAWPLSRVATLAVVVSAFNLLSYNSESTRGSSFDVPVHRHSDGWRKDFVKRQAIGIDLAQRLPHDATIAVTSAGVIAFYAELTTIDMLGLNNEHIAHHGRRDRRLPFGHQAGDGRYVLQQAPAAIVLGPAGLRRPQNYISEREIWADPEFHEMYEAVELEKGTWIYLRHDAANRVEG